MRGLRFEPLEKAPDVPPDLAAPAASRVAIVQLREPLDQGRCTGSPGWASSCSATSPRTPTSSSATRRCEAGSRPCPRSAGSGRTTPRTRSPRAFSTAVPPRGERPRPTGAMPHPGLRSGYGFEEGGRLAHRAGRGRRRRRTCPDPIGRSHRLMPVHPRKYRVTAELANRSIRAGPVRFGVVHRAVPRRGRGRSGEGCGQRFHRRGIRDAE